MAGIGTGIRVGESWEEFRLFDVRFIMSTSCPRPRGLTTHLSYEHTFAAKAREKCGTNVLKYHDKLVCFAISYLGPDPLDTPKTGVA
jgi:hypothetical protein